MEDGVSTNIVKSIGRLMLVMTDGVITMLHYSTMNTMSRK